jgi:hypothetical protein
MDNHQLVESLRLVVRNEMKMVVNEDLRTIITDIVRQEVPPMVTDIVQKEVPPMVTSIVQKEIPPMVTSIVQKEVPPIVTSIVQKEVPLIVTGIVHEEMRPLDEKLTATYEQVGQLTVDMMELKSNVERLHSRLNIQRNRLSALEEKIQLKNESAQGRC